MTNRRGFLRSIAAASTIPIVQPPEPSRLLLPDGTHVGYMQFEGRHEKAESLAIPYQLPGQAYHADDPLFDPWATPKFGTIRLTRSGNDWILEDPTLLDTIKRCRAYTRNPSYPKIGDSEC